jgi:hypothetical protein
MARESKELKPDGRAAKERARRRAADFTQEEKENIIKP